MPNNVLLDNAVNLTEKLLFVKREEPTSTHKTGVQRAPALCRGSRGVPLFLYSGRVGGDEKEL